MSFLGFPFPESVQSFATHSQVLDYLCSYADQHELHPLIKLGCPVESIRPIPIDSSPTPLANSVNAAADGSDEMPPAAKARGEQDKPEAFDGWEVVYRRDRGNGSTREHVGIASNGGGDGATSVVEIFDAVCVCNGHFDKPFVPQVEGFEGFQGTSMHAYAYDTPDVETFVGRRVLCVGSRSSGADIAREVSSVASAVHVCDRAASESLRGGERGKVWWRPALEKFEGANTVWFKDGTSAEVDTVVWCTSYSYSFPFLEGSGLLTHPSKLRVHPLYEQLFHVKHPSLSFVGLPYRIVPFPLFEVQANAVAAVIGGRSSLPSLAEREQWLKNEEETGQRERSISPTSRAVHVLEGLQWTYLRRLLRLAAPGAVARPPSGFSEAVTAGADVNSPGGAGLGNAALPSGAREAANELKVKEENIEEVLRTLAIREAIYNDASDSRPKFPGAPDDYRLREYRVDRESASFSVSLADRKANGEDPSAAVAAAAAAIASLDLKDKPAEA
eukprot:jgi/Undpi1/3930/HiC_scaffold_16.g07298.m1